MEFRRRLDPDLPFYYYTSAHERFYEGELSTFAEKPARPRRLRRAPCREQLMSQVGRRVTLVQWGHGSIRGAWFHTSPVPQCPSGTATSTKHQSQC